MHNPFCIINHVQVLTCLHKLKDVQFKSSLQKIKCVWYWNAYKYAPLQVSKLPVNLNAFSLKTFFWNSKRVYIPPFHPTHVIPMHWIEVFMFFILHHICVQQTCVNNRSSSRLRMCTGCRWIFATMNFACLDYLALPLPQANY